MKTATLILILAFSVSLGLTLTQTDWSSGPGVSGPVNEWGSSFSSSSNVYTEYERLQIHAGNPVQNPEMEIIENWWFCNAFDFPEPLTDEYAHFTSPGPDSTMLFWENASGTGEWTVHTIGSVPEMWVLAMAGYDGDGDGDIDIAGAGSDSLYFWENTGLPGSWPRSGIATTLTDLASIEPGDMNCDNVDDLVVCDTGIIWYELTGQGWVEHIAVPAGAYFYSVLDDLDSDGDMDIAAIRCIPGDDELVWLENPYPSDDTWTEHLIAQDLPALLDVAVADMNGDGHIDVLSGQSWEYEDYNGGYIIWWENNGGSGPSFTPCTLSTEGAKDMAVADLDLDGDPDIASLITFGEPWDDGYSLLHWLENTGAGQFTEHSLWESTEYSTILCARLFGADTDCDGVAELYTSLLGYTSAAFMEFKLMEFEAEGWLESSILDAGYGADWSLFQFNGHLQSGDQISFQVRSSSDPSDMGPWSSPFSTPETSLTGLLEDSTRYFQYRVNFTSTTPGTTPVLYDLAASCDHTGTGYTQGNRISVEPVVNPARGGVTLRVTAGSPGEVSLKILDLSGRVLASRNASVPEGSSMFSFREVPPGIYFCTAESSYNTETMRVAVTE